MTEVKFTPSCARAEDLIAYLYGELEATSAHHFEAHIQHCVNCRAELTGFRQVRGSIGEWRQQALGSLVSTSAMTNAHTLSAPVRIAPERRRSALAALREFFALSPTWMRAATAAVAVVFCVLIVLSIAHFKESPQVVTVKSSEVNFAKLADWRGQPKETALNSTFDSPAPSPSVVEITAPKGRTRPRANRSLRQGAPEQPKIAGARKLKISPEESREIARDLRLIASKDEEDLPRLSDLLGESN